MLSIAKQLHYMGIANAVAKGSKDDSTKVGAVLIRPDKTIASTGFNGFPPRIPDRPEWLLDRVKKYPRMVHAEANCLDFNRDHDTRGFHLVVNLHPCDACALRIASTGIDFVYYRPDEGFETRWADKVSVAKEILNDAAITLIAVTSGEQPSDVASG